MNRQPNILFVTPVLGHPPKGGPELRIENSIKALAMVSTLSLYCRTSAVQMGGVAALRFLGNYANRIYFAPFCRAQSGLADFVQRGINRISRVLVGRNILPARPEDESDYADVVATAQSLGVDVIWLGYGNISYPLLKYIKDHSDFPVVLDTDSVWSRYVFRELPYARDEADRQRIEAKGKLKAEEEQWGTELADMTTGVSEVDVEYYRGLISNPARVRVFSNVIDLASYAATPVPQNFSKPCMYLAGTFWPGSPMENAARWMLDHVLPLLKPEFPELHFYIAGKASDTVLADVHDANVTITGTLPSVLPYLTNATVVVVPLHFESGTRFKILEAGACAVAVVSTTLGAEGIPVTDGKDILLADTPELFAQAVARVIRDSQLAASLGLNLRELIARNFSLDTLAQEGKEILQYVMRPDERTERKAKSHD